MTSCDGLHSDRTKIAERLVRILALSASNYVGARDSRVQDDLVSKRRTPAGANSSSSKAFLFRNTQSAAVKRHGHVGSTASPGQSAEPDPTGPPHLSGLRIVRVGGRYRSETHRRIGKRHQAPFVSRSLQEGRNDSNPDKSKRVGRCFGHCG